MQITVMAGTNVRDLPILSSQVRFVSPAPLSVDATLTGDFWKFTLLKCDLVPYTFYALQANPVDCYAHKSRVTVPIVIVTPPPNAPQYLRGIDVSRWQGAINWAQVAPNIDFAYIKVGGGDDSNGPYFDYWANANYDGTQSARVRRGNYWFFSGRNTIQSQADMIAKWRQSHSDDLPWAIDIEDVSRGAEDIRDGLALAETVAQMTGKPPLVYTGAWWWNPRWGKALSLGVASTIPYPLWIASYTQEPIIPSGWGDWKVWQFSDRGSVPGIAGGVDMNRSHIFGGILN